MGHCDYTTREDSPEILKRLRELEQTAKERLETLYGEHNIFDGFCRKRNEPEARRSADHNTQMRAFLDIRRAARQAIEVAQQGKLAGMEFRVEMFENILQKASDPEMAELFLLAKDAGQMILLKIAHEKKRDISFSQSAKEFRQREAAFTKFVRSAKTRLTARLLVRQKQSVRHAFVAPRLLVRARSYRRSRHVATVNSGGGDDGGQGEPPEPPRQAPPVIPNKLSDSNSFPSPWLGHGCFCMGRCPA